MFTIYGIPTCDKVRQARRWLDEHGHEHSFVDFRAQPVGRERIAAWVGKLGAPALRNTSGGSYRALPKNKAEWTDAEWIEAFAADPMLIKRPVVERDGEPIQAGFKGDLDQ